MKLRYIYSACVTIETPTVRILCDPWFTPGADGGSWLQYPPLARPAVDVIGPTDLVYISHIHSDHYDPLFLRTYLQRYPKAQIVVGESKLKLLEKRMHLDGFTPQVVSSRNYGGTTLAIFPNRSDPLDHDTALLVTHGEQAIANMNDNHIDEGQIKAIREACPTGRPDLALLPYCGAGPYPQTYRFDNDAQRDAAVARKQAQFLGYYQRYVELLNPVRAMPFAGTYVLGGPLARLNGYRGMPDATAVLSLNGCGERSIVLADGGDAVYDLDTMTANQLRTRPYDDKAIAAYLQSIPFNGYDYEREFRPIGNRPIPIVPMVDAAQRRARAVRPSSEPWWICLKPSTATNFIVINSKDDVPLRIANSVTDLEPRWEIHIDDRLLFLTLTRYYHWEEVEGGSLFASVRRPDVYRKDVEDFLYFLSI